MNPLFSFSGIASGIDTASIVSGLVTLERQPITRIEKQQDSLRSKQDKINGLKSLLETLRDKGKALNSRSSVLASSGSSSDESVMGVTAAGGASLGSFDLTVTQVATAQRSISSFSTTASDATGELTNGTITFSLGGEDLVVTIDGNTSLDSIASQINESGLEMTAGVVQADSGYHLVVTGNNTGTDNAITITPSDATNLAFSTPQTADDAIIELDSLTITRGSNSITDAINGVTLDIKAKGTSTVTIQRDAEALGEVVTEFVNAYNAFNKKINYELFQAGQESTDGTLIGESVVRTAQQRMRTVMTDRVDGLDDTYSYLGSIGVSMDRSGVLTLDQTALEEALADDPEAIAKLFAGDEDTNTDGLLTLVDDQIDALINTSDGLFTARTKGIDTRIDGLDDQIYRMELRVEKFEEQLRKQFTTMEMAVGMLQGQSNQLMAMLGGG